MEALKPIEVACPLCEAKPGRRCRNILRKNPPEVVWVHYPREDAARDTNLPDGITSFHPIAYGVRRWNGVVWQRYMVDEYNKRLGIIERLHRAGHDSQHEIEALYQLATQWSGIEWRPSVPETAIYKLGALSVREASPKGFAVYFEHGIESTPKPLMVPPRTPSGMHPLFDGQEVSTRVNHFRTKTGARRYMLALAAADILPEDRPATHDEVLAIRDWITDQAL